MAEACIFFSFWHSGASTWHVLIAGAVQCVRAVWTLVCRQIPVRSAAWALLLTGGAAEPPKGGGWGQAVAALCRHPHGGQQVHLVHDAAGHSVVGGSCVALVGTFCTPLATFPTCPPTSRLCATLSRTFPCLCSCCASYVSVTCGTIPYAQHVTVPPECT